MNASHTTLKLAILMALTNVAYADNAKHRFDIPPQPLSSALQILAHQSGSQMLYAEQSASGKYSQGLSGYYTTQEAADKLLSGSGLVHQVADTGTVTVKPSGGAYAGGEGQVMPKVTVEAEAETEADPYDPYNTTDPYNKSYLVTNALTATKTDTPVFDTPLSIQVVPKSVLKDQQAIRPKTALRNISGVSPGFGFGGLRDRSIIRGFPTDNFPQGGSYLDGVLQFEATNSLANIDRVEVLKGASAMLYGRLEPGGIINYASKRPLAKAYYALEQQFGSFENYRTTADATGPLTSDNSLLYRVNFEYFDTESFRDFVFSQRSFVAPSLTWKISSQTQLDFDFIYNDQDDPNDYGLPAFGTGIARIPRSRYTGEPSNLSETTTFQGAITLNHAFNEDWKLKSKFSKYNMSGHFDETVLATLDERTGIGERWLYEAPIGTDSYFFTTDITGKFKTGTLKHTLLFGMDYLNRQYHEDGKFIQRFSPDDVGIFPSPINIFNPVYGYDKQAVLNANPRSFFQTEDEWYGLYLQDQIDITDQWHAMLGTRFDHAESKVSNNPARTADAGTRDDKFSPRVGLMYQPWDWLGLYGNYSESFNRPNVNVDLSAGAKADPEVSSQYEFGLKGRWFDDKLTANAVYFDLTKENVATPISRLPNAPNRLTGAARSRGLELDLSGQLTEDWDVIVTYTYLDSVVTKDTQFQGNRLPNVPHHMGSLWTNYRFDNLGVPGLKAGGGVFLASSRFGDQDNSFQMPGYARVDAFLAYQFKLNGATLTTQFNVENLLDKDYFESTTGNSFNGRFSVLPGTSRTFLGSVRLEY